ncbi:MAG: hypothetical protein Hyperionvirus22_33 [Hyperionvirus sp.]|uniref:Uncharacterized protein n=1 Tax=Hyperionvirus sp. TaxID=2487770 RepID=A0A3G5AB26_9VIRU|nr:MAG: hypothetical protein Hyperionvirus22_33 [Hyperionvirus sp.]
MVVCDTFLKNPVACTICALLIDEGLRICCSLQQRKKFYNGWGVCTTIGCLIWFCYEAFIVQKMTFSFEAVAWFVDFVPAVLLTLLMAKDYDLKKLLLNPTYLLVDVCCSEKKDKVRGDLFVNLYVSLIKLLFIGAIVIVECFLWWPIVLIWSKDHCFIDGMTDVGTPFGVYVTSMVVIMYLNMVAYFKDCDRLNVFVKIVLWGVSFLNTTFALAVFCGLVE